jgi:hypothetical protein
MLDLLRAGGFNMLVLAAIGGPMVFTAGLFARRADPHRLSLVRALTVAELVAACVGFFAGLIATCQAAPDAPEPALIARLLVGFAESCANLVLGGALCVISWVLIAVGVRRMPREPA